MDRLPPKSDPGYTDALYHLAGTYYSGLEGRERDREQSFRLWKEAAEMGHLDSRRWLGQCYKYGLGCEKDLDLSLVWYEKAAQRDNVKSMVELGACYKLGHGCQQDSDLALEWWEKAAQQEDGPDELCYVGILGIGQGNYSVAYTCLSIASRFGHKQAMLKLGDCYKLGYGCKQDSDLALELWEKVARKEDGPDELYRNGLNGIGGGKYDSVGYKCLSIASKHGNKKALEFLMFYHHHSGSTGTVDEKLQKLRKIQDEDPSEFIAVFLLAECLSNSFKLKALDEATSLLATIPQDVTFYARSQWLVPFLEEKMNIICLSAQSGQCFPTESDYFDPKQLKIVALIGEGQFGKVYLASLSSRDRRWVAVKYLNDNEFEDHQDAVTKLMRERLANQILKSSNSRNTAKYMGIVTHFENRKSGLVFEICADLSLVLEDAEDRINEKDYVGRYGTISSFDSLPDWRFRVPSSLRSAVVFARATSFSMAQLLEIFRNVAVALQCLHILGILHRDIADRNVLCDGEGNVQLADFGLSRFVGVGTDFDDQMMLEYSHKLTEGNQYAVAWWPPECLGEEPIFSFASDVYSFFVMMWQCLAGADPFEDLLKEGEGDPFVRVSEAILSGQRPDLGKLRHDPPCRLLNLIEDAWGTDPLSRPSVTKVISELNEILDELNESTAHGGVTRRRRGNQPERRWFDIQKMYLEIPHSKMIQAAQDSGKGSFEDSLLQRQVAEKLQTAASMTVLSKATITLLGGRRPYDVFIVHAGEQKLKEVSSLKRTFELYGYRCFLDREMKNVHGRPVDQMAFALATCRYVVAVVSKDFLTKKWPCNELQNAFDRAQWLEDPSSSSSRSKSWRSLHVILLDLTVNEYTTAQADTRRPAENIPLLPALGKEVVMKEYANGQRMIKDWQAQSEELGDELMSHDKEQGAVDRWNAFLQGWDSLSDRGFPWADSVYFD